VYKWYISICFVDNLLHLLGLYSCEYSAVVVEYPRFLILGFFSSADFSIAVFRFFFGRGPGRRRAYRLNKPNSQTAKEAIQRLLSPAAGFVAWQRAK